MSHVLAAPDFAREGGFLSDFKQVASRVAGVGRRPGPSSVAKDEDQETMQYLYSRGVPRDTAMYAVAMAKKTDPESSDPTYIIVEWRQDRLNELNQEWGAPDPAAFVRGALIASGMTETEDPRVLGLKDDKLTSTRNNFVEGRVGFPPMIQACGLSEIGAPVFGQAARLPVVDAVVLLANGGKPRPLLPGDVILWIG